MIVVVLLSNSSECLACARCQMQQGPRGVSIRANASPARALAPRAHDKQRANDNSNNNGNS